MLRSLAVFLEVRTEICSGRMELNLTRREDRPQGSIKLSHHIYSPPMPKTKKRSAYHSHPPPQCPHPPSPSPPSGRYHHLRDHSKTARKLPATNNTGTGTPSHPIRIQTQLKARYPVLDHSSKVPFDLIFGLRRKFDSDPCNIAFQTPHSLLDVPYALANGLLGITELRRFSEDNKIPGEHVEVDLSALRDGMVDDSGDGDAMCRRWRG
jgi:hypothetical protein